MFVLLGLHHSNLTRVELFKAEHQTILSLIC